MFREKPLIGSWVGLAGGLRVCSLICWVSPSLRLKVKRVEEVSFNIESRLNNKNNEKIIIFQRDKERLEYAKK